MTRCPYNSLRKKIESLSKIIKGIKKNQVEIVEEEVIITEIKEFSGRDQ